MSFGRALAIWALLAASACKEKPEARLAEPAQRRDEETKEVEAELARQPERPSGVAPAPVAVPEDNALPSAAQLPVPEDFQPETTTTIMRANYLSELDRLENEVRADEN